MYSGKADDGCWGFAATAATEAALANDGDRGGAVDIIEGALLGMAAFTEFGGGPGTEGTL